MNTHPAATTCPCPRGCGWTITAHWTTHQSAALATHLSDTHRETPNPHAVKQTVLTSRTPR